MKLGWRRVPGVALAIGGCALLALLSGITYSAESTAGAVIRLAWRARGERERHCRRPTAQELEKLPAHMRPEEICERGIAPYRLRVTLDDALARDELVRAGGAQADRPLFVFAELAVAPGAHRLSIVFERKAGDHTDEVHEENESERGESQGARETPRRLTLDETVTLAPGAIVLVTYDDERQRLALLAASDRGR